MNYKNINSLAQKLFLGILVLLSTESRGSEIPKWLSEPISEDETAFYGHGVGEDPSDSVALKAAEVEALSDLIKTNLGFDFSDETAIAANLESVKLQKSSHQKTALVKLIDIKISKVERQIKANGNILYFVQRSVPKEIISKIKKDLDQNEVLEHTLLSVTFDTKPSGAELQIDGRSVGQTPLKLFLPPGIHSVVSKKVGFKEQVRKLALDKSTDYSFELILERIEGSLELKISPFDADIKIARNNEQFIGKISSMPPGEYEVAISKSGYLDERRNFSILANRTTTLEINLNPYIAKIANPSAPHSSLDDDIRNTFSKLMDEKKYQDAIDHLETNWEPRFGKSSTYYVLKGWAQMENGQYEMALKHLNISLKMAKGNMVFQKLCKTNYLVQNYSLAIQYCDQALTYKSGTTALLYKARSNLKLAVENYRKREYHTQAAVNNYEILSRLFNFGSSEVETECSTYPANTTNACKIYLKKKGGKGQFEPR